MAWRAFLRDFNQAVRDVDGDNFCPSFRCNHRERTRTATCVQQAHALHIGWQGRQQQIAHIVTPGAHSGPDSADGNVGSQILPSLARCLVEIGFELGSALLIAGRGEASVHHSNPRKSKISRSFMGRAS